MVRLFAITGAALAVLVTIIIALAFRDARLVARVMAEITSRQRPIAEAAYEVEINVFELSAAARSYRVSRSPADLRLVAENRMDLERAMHALDSLSGSDGTLAARRELRRLAVAYLEATDSVIALAATSPPTTLTARQRQALTRFANTQLALNVVLDRHIQPATDSALRAAAAEASARSRRTAWITAVLAPLAVLLGLVAIRAPVRAYARMREANAETQRISAQKTEFASITAHELRSPLTAILGSLRLMSTGRAGPMPETARPYLEMSTRNAVRLLALINELLELDRLDAGMMPFALTAVPCAEVLRPPCEGLAGMAAELSVRIEVRCDTSRRVRADAIRLHQVVTNLVSNALKHAPRDSVVTVSAVDKADVVRFEVRDEGPGIRPADRERIFQRFVQTGSAAQHASTGLGLTIANEIVRRHEGRIGVESELGRGATFWFEVPVASG